MAGTLRHPHPHTPWCKRTGTVLLSALVVVALIGRDGLAARAHPLPNAADAPAGGFDPHHRALRAPSEAVDVADALPPRTHSLDLADDGAGKAVTSTVLPTLLQENATVLSKSKIIVSGPILIALAITGAVLGAGGVGVAAAKAHMAEVTARNLASIKLKYLAQRTDICSSVDVLQKGREKLRESMVEILEGAQSFDEGGHVREFIDGFVDLLTLRSGTSGMASFTASFCDPESPDFGATEMRAEAEKLKKNLKMKIATFCIMTALSAAGTIAQGIEGAAGVAHTGVQWAQVMHPAEATVGVIFDGVVEPLSAVGSKVDAPEVALNAASAVTHALEAVAPAIAMQVASGVASSLGVIFPIATLVVRAGQLAVAVVDMVKSKEKWDKKVDSAKEELDTRLMNLQGSYCTLLGNEYVLNRNMLNLMSNLAVIPARALEKNAKDHGFWNGALTLFSEHNAEQRAMTLEKKERALEKVERHLYKIEEAKWEVKDLVYKFNSVATRYGAREESDDEARKRDLEAAASLRKRKADVRAKLKRLDPKKPALEKRKEALEDELLTLREERKEALRREEEKKKQFARESAEKKAALEKAVEQLNAHQRLHRKHAETVRARMCTMPVVFEAPIRMDPRFACIFEGDTIVDDLAVTPDVHRLAMSRSTECPEEVAAAQDKVANMKTQLSCLRGETQQYTDKGVCGFCFAMVTLSKRFPSFRFAMGDPLWCNELTLDLPEGHMRDAAIERCRNVASKLDSQEYQRFDNVLEHGCSYKQESFGNFPMVVPDTCNARGESTHSRIAYPRNLEEAKEDPTCGAYEACVSLAMNPDKIIRFCNPPIGYPVYNTYEPPQQRSE